MKFSFLETVESTAAEVFSEVEVSLGWTVSSIIHVPYRRSWHDIPAWCRRSEYSNIREMITVL